VDSEELVSVEDLVVQYAPELIPPLKRQLRVDAYITAFVLAAFGTYVSIFAVIEGSGGVAGPWILALTGGWLGLGGLLAERFVQHRYRKDYARFQRDLQQSPWKVYDLVASKFAEEIERQRARTLGPQSEWGRARQPLEHAAQEAARSVAYWQQRAAMEPDNVLPREQLQTAEQLRGKFDKALTELDARAHVLVSFFNQCEAKVAVLQYAKRDYDESRKLGALSARADEVVAHANETLARIGTGFLQEAIRVGTALGGLERVGILSQAANTPVDQIESLADRILESSFQERATLERLTKDVSQ
jgi:hypothetical protein